MRIKSHGLWQGISVVSFLWIASLVHLSFAQQSVQFNRDIRPILADKCLACHGMDAGNRQAELRLDSPEGSRESHGGTAAIVPGDPAASELWLRINEEDPDLRMPPADSNKVVTDEEKLLLRRWIEEGAEYQGHWAFEQPRLPAIPSGEIHSNPVDAFIADRLTREGMTMSVEAEKHILVRRVAFALTGLPPTPEQVASFTADRSSEAYEKMVDGYLSSPHFGEEMARHWLDVARYADTHGMHLDNERQMWAYRDWVVDSFNSNKRFDDFTIEQIAGDLLPEPTMEQLVATGFNRCNVTSSEGGSIDEELLYRYAVDRTSTVAQTWLGLTAGCAACHDHKFDPVSQKEFYSLYAFFNSAADPAMDGNALLTQPFLRLERESDRERLRAIAQQLEDLQKQVEEMAREIAYSDPADADPLPEPVAVNTTWLDDEFPESAVAKASPGHPTTFVSVADGAVVFSGERALKRSDKGLAQDVWEGATIPLSIPAEAIIYAHVYLDPGDLPGAIMVQFYKNGWLHRAVWGDYDAIGFGTPNTTEKVLMGPLPEAGKWVRLEVPAEKIGLATGDLLTGFATTQFGGTVLWDAIGVSGISDPAKDPQQSFRAWWSRVQGNGVQGLDGDLNEIAKAGPTANAAEDDRQRLLAWYLHTTWTESKPRFADLDKQIAELKSRSDLINSSIPGTLIYRDTPQPRESFVMLRGEYDKRGERVEPGVPAVFPPLQLAEGQTTATRLDLARWLVSPENPLTARVATNRIWQQFFGTGLVSTSGDFGTQGELPSHPELLDWLAVHFRDSGWDVKSLVRMIVTSKTFRQRSTYSRELLERDPSNRLLARAPRLRLDAEQIRDNALFVSGLINLRFGGAGVKPYQPDNIWEPVGFAGSNTRFYRQDSGEDLYRRSLYTFYKRTAPPPFMVNFDAPNREQSCSRRERSNTPLQALQLMNDVQHVEAARQLAARMILEGGTTPEGRIGFAYRIVVCRDPHKFETEVLREQLALHLGRYRENPDDATKLISQGESKPAAELDSPELAAYTLVASTILNLDETLNRN